MKRSFQLLALVATAACHSTPAVVDADPVQRDALFSPIAALEGHWSSAHPMNGESTVTEFSLSSNGSAVREVMMVGTPHEMTNMYTLDGNSLVMTHYCAGGNQPRMRAVACEGNRIFFAPDSVADLKDADDVYMGEMTLVMVDADHVEQHWKALKAGEFDHETVIKLERVR